MQLCIADPPPPSPSTPSLQEAGRGDVTAARPPEHNEQPCRSVEGEWEDQARRSRCPTGEVQPEWEVGGLMGGSGGDPLCCKHAHTGAHAMTSVCASVPQLCGFCQ